MELKKDIVRRLRKETGVGIMICKQALFETNWDYPKAKVLVFKLQEKSRVI